VIIFDATAAERLRSWTPLEEVDRMRIKLGLSTTFRGAELGAIGVPGLHPIEATSRAKQASKAKAFGVTFVRDILSTSLSVSNSQATTSKANWMPGGRQEPGRGWIRKKPGRKIETQ
jgi:hypothetical protein